MSKTIDPFPHSVTIGDKYGPAMAITDQSEADAYFKRCVEHSMRYYSREEAERIERQNLGYYAGYYSQETRERVEKLFCAVHPFLGSADRKLSPREILLTGASQGHAQKPGKAPVLSQVYRCQKKG